MSAALRGRLRGSRLTSGLVDRLQAAGMVGVLAIAAAVPLTDIARTWWAARAEKAAWDGITGPACDVAASAPVSRRLPRTFTYGDATFTRQHGHVSCAGFRDDGQVYRICQFNAPGYVSVTTPRGTTVFSPPPVRRTTVTVRDGVATCVVGGWFRN
ncbi:hypothetical protein LRS10_01060 [Phenylobacterium sp. J426]|uniref:hypothetical protein n=1 Tax=Phenylobacterium sp. J426 TaxID=2898439 RepID=UPI00215178C0|nr:hypothetical protein [Phenylobacterium sp. J426]MCR5872907.1 hypothetical protein [Phenylobacterium sp. J426]